MHPPKDVGNNLKYEIDFIIKHSEFLCEHITKKIVNYCLQKVINGKQ